MESRSPPFPCIFSAVRHNSAVSQKSTRLSPPHTRHTRHTRVTHMSHMSIVHVHPSLCVLALSLSGEGLARPPVTHILIWYFFHFCFECCLSVPLWRTRTAKMMNSLINKVKWKMVIYFKCWDEKQIWTSHLRSYHYFCWPKGWMELEIIKTITFFHFSCF